MVTDWTTLTWEALRGLMDGFVEFIPSLIGAILVFVIGWFIAVWIGRLVAEILKRVRFDKIFEKTKWDEALEKADFKMKMSGFIGGLIKWVLVIVFLGVALGILRISGVDEFVKKMIAFLPRLVIATGIFVVAVVVAEFAEKLIKAVVSKMNVGYVNLVGAIVRWSIWIVAAVAILQQFEVKGVEWLMQIVVAGIMLGLALAFGLGGKDVAREALQEARNKIRR